MSLQPLTCMRRKVIEIMVSKVTVLSFGNIPISLFCLCSGFERGPEPRLFTLCSRVLGFCFRDVRTRLQ